MTNRHNRFAQWMLLRLWRVRCRWHGRRLHPGARVRFVGPYSSFQGRTGTVVETADEIPMWRLVELDEPVERGGERVSHVNADTVSLAKTA